MSEPIVRLLSDLAEAVMAGRFEAVTPHYAYPLPLFFKDELIVYNAPRALANGLSIYRAAAIGIGTVRLFPRLVAQGLPVQGHSSAWIEWDHLDAQGRCLRTNQVRYGTYQPAADACPKIEILDYTALAFPELQNALPTTQSA